MSRPANSLRAVVLAGGRGTRLAPFTSILPKPLLPVGDRAILEILVDRLREQGITNVTLCVGHLSHLIRAVFDNGNRHGVEISYVFEEERLGTAGPLRLVEGLDDTFLVLNGDILTSINFQDLVEHHRACGSMLTIATHERTTRLDYGVIEMENRSNGKSEVIGYDEKPEIALAVSMGIYVFDPRALEFIPDLYFDFPDLVRKLLEAGEPVAAYPFDGYWLDIGRHEDYETAVDDWQANQASAS